MDATARETQDASPAAPHRCQGADRRPGRTGGRRADDPIARLDTPADYLSAVALAAYWGVAYRTVNGWIRDGYLAACHRHRDSREWYVRTLVAVRFERELFAGAVRRLTATRSRRRMNALGRSIHVRGKGCAHDHDRFAHRDPSSSFSLVRTQARERGSACPARPIRTPPSGSI